ncbi:MAG TPA: RHS repeat-associated core domain-containing protein [Ktedonobacteraceae bacterium]|nr:RHS repeat-associated core domain-containing protein [Ktedonobacteraceae bacterium]
MGAAGWVGEGWNLSLGSINWAEHNVVANCQTSGCGTNWENTWQISDPFGTSSELIPPNINVSTYYDDTPNDYCGTGSANAFPCPILWHTATESHAKIYSYVGPLNISMPTNPPCFRAWLPNGIMEEFGCTADSLQYYYIPGIGFAVSGWNLDLITDPQGNQIHLTYQRDLQTVTDSTGKVLTYPRDAVLSTVEYDSPNCRNAQTMCTGSNWAPLVRVNFSASHSVTRRTGTAPTGCNTGASLRCDDPVDLSGSGGAAAPQVQSTFVLNDVQVQVRGSGTATWNTLHDYQLGYEQSAPTTILDPVTGKNESVAGMLDLTQIQEVGTNGTTTLPMHTFSYTTQTNYYEDDQFHPNPSTNCGPSWNTGNGSGCLLWSQSYPNNSRYLASSSNGMGMAQSFSYAVARDNTHGVPGGGSNNADPLYCNSHQSGYPCNEADDQNWSHVVLMQESSTTVRLTQNGQGGQQTSTPVTDTSSYIYQLSYPLIAQECGDCVAGMYWGNQNDGDYLGFYNGKFMGFSQVTVSLSDGAKEVHKYFATEGYGLYDMSQVKCFASTPCHAAPWWHLNNAAHGHEYETFLYDTDGQTLLQHQTTTYQAVCPPSGVSATPAYTAWGNWDGQLVSALDHNSPVAVCDIQQTQQVSEIHDGSGSSVTTTTVPTYDSFGRVTQETTSSNSGSPSQVIQKTTYVWNNAITATKTSASGTYIIDTPAFTDTEDGSGNRLTCTYTNYDGQGYLTGQTTALTGGQATTETKDANCGTSANGYTPSGPSTTTTTYDPYGNTIGTNDADANAGIGGHVGCTVSSVQHTDCTTYDSIFKVYPVATANVLNQTSSTSYANTGALFGFGTWPTSTTDANGQTTSVTYDALGRMAGETLPGETSGLLTKQWSYTSWCSGTAAQSPCIEIDETDRINSSTTITTRAFYDGEERLVETRAPGFNGQDVVIYAYYDNAGRQVFKSNPYFVAAYTGAPGAAAYSIPDSTQPGTSTSFPNQRTTSVTDPNSHTSTTTSSVICGVSGTSDAGCYVQSMVVDANGHQSTTLTGGQGKRNYAQSYTGTGGSATLYATTAYTFDASGNLLATKSPDGSTTSVVYDNLGRVTSQSDPDRGTTTFTYDPNGNVTQSVDARGSAGTVFTGYDGLNRPLWKNSVNSPTGAFASYTYDSTANGNDGVGQLTGESFTGSGSLSGSYAYTFDGRGQQVSETVTVNGTSYPVQSTYDDHGQVSSQTYPTGEVVTPGYSSTGWLASLTDQTGSTVTTIASNLTYSGLAGAAGKITAMSFGNGANYAASYDTGTRLTAASLTQTSTNAVVYATQPAYDAASNVTGVQTSISSATDVQQFCYDNLDRLTWAGATGTPPCVSLTPGTLTAAQYQQSNTYTVENGLVTGPAGSYTYGNSSHPHAITAASNGYSAAYDAEGNLTCRAPSSATTCNGTQTGQQLSYDIEGRLSTWQNQPGSPSSTANYLYDGAGNRVAMQTTVNGTATLTAYIGSIEEVQTTGGATTTTTYYAVSGSRIAAKVNGTLYYFGYDALGSQVAVLDSSGNLIGSQLYGPYGNSRYNSGILPTSIGFTGQQADSVSGLDYYVARYYDPVVGQFLAADTVQGNAQGTDPYAYVGGNPETRADPSGHCWPICTAIIGAAIGAVVGATVGIVHEAAQHGTNFGSYNWGSVAVNAGVGAVAGALVGTGVGAMAIGASGVVAGGAAVGLSASASMTLASVTTAAAIGAGTGAVSSAIGAYASHQSFADGLQSVFEGASIGAISSAATEGIGSIGALGARAMFSGGAGLGRALVQGAIQAGGGFASDVAGQVWDNWANGRRQSINWGSALFSGGIGFVGGFAGQWSFNHWHLPGQGATSRAARTIVNNRRWFWQGVRSSAVSGVVQGGLQGIRTGLPALTSSSHVNYVGRLGWRYNMF